MKVSLIVTFLNKWNLTHARLMEIYQKLSVDEVILADDGSTDEDVFKGIQFWRTVIPLVHVRSLQPTSFGQNVNRSVKKATGDIVVITQNDVVFKEDVIKKIRAIIEEDEKVLIGGRVIDFDGGWNRFGNVVVPYAEGWLLACTKKAWEDIGGFDENIKPYDAEDVELSIRAKSKGYTLKSLHNIGLKHLQGKTITYGSEREEITKKNIEYVKNKWKDKLEELYG